MRKSVLLIIPFFFPIAIFSQVPAGEGPSDNSSPLPGIREVTAPLTGYHVTNHGTVKLGGNLNNTSVSGSDLGDGTFLLNGAGVQHISGTNVFGNLAVNDAAGVVLNNNTVVNGTLTFTSGKVVLGSNNLLLGTSASVAGTPSFASMVVATGTGEMRKSFSGAGSFTFPVGDTTGIAEYSPVTVAFTGGTFGSNNYAGVSLVNASFPGYSNSYLKRYWTLTQSGITGFTCNATFQYLSADVTGNESEIWCTKVSPTPVVRYNVANTSLHQLSANGLTTFGTFSGVQAEKNLNLAVFLEGLYNGTGSMRKAQNAGGDQFPGNTADQFTIALHNSSNYALVEYSATDVNLSTAGLASVTIPAIHGGSYYITIKHRNSIETTTAAPVSFAPGTITYSFDAPLKAYGGNLHRMFTGEYAIYGGDVNQDGIVGPEDLTGIDGLASIFASGYLPEDVNGDGVIDSNDLVIADNNASIAISSVLP